MKKWIVIALLVFPLAVKAQLMSCRHVIPNGYNFWLYLPEDYATAAEKKPLVMFLHGKSLSGNNLDLVRKYGCIDAVSRGREIDAVIVAPQTQEAWNPAKVLDVYHWVTKNYQVDTSRFYVVGMSMGGYGTLDFVATYPEMVAAAMAFCGGATVTELCGLNQVPLWIIHGTADSAVPVGCSQKVVDEMAACGDTSLLLFDKFVGVNHTRLARLFYIEETYDWLFAHSLADSVRTLHNEFSITKESLNDAFADLQRNTQLKVVEYHANDTQEVEKQYYTIKKGDTLSSIAVEYNTTVSILCKLNNIKKTTVLRVGRKLRVK
jgi:dienelactone hydrolase